MIWLQNDFYRDSVKLHYWSKGSGAPLLLLHGITDNGACWGRTADALAAHFTVYALDQSGHGKSDAPIHGYTFDHYVADALELLRVTGHGTAIVMGHSFGGVIGLKMAASHPEAVTKLIAVDPPLFDIPLSTPAAVLDENRYTFFEWLRKIKPLSRAELIASCRVREPRWSDDECEQWAESKLDASPHLWEQGGIETRSDWRDWLALITCPTMLVYGERAMGGLIDDAKAAEVVSALAHGQAVQIIKAGHSVYRDEFPAFTQAITPFLQT